MIVAKICFQHYSYRICLKIKLNSVLEKNASGIVQVTGSPSITEMKVNYATVEETDPALTNYIVITLPDAEYKNYAKLRTKKHLKSQGAILQMFFTSPTVDIC